MIEEFMKEKPYNLESHNCYVFCKMILSNFAEDYHGEAAEFLNG